MVNRILILKYSLIPSLNYNWSKYIILLISCYILLQIIEAFGFHVQNEIFYVICLCAPYQTLESMLFWFQRKACGLYGLHQFKQECQRLHLVYLIQCMPEYFLSADFWEMYHFGSIYFYCDSNWIVWVF